MLDSSCTEDKLEDVTIDVEIENRYYHKLLEIVSGTQGRVILTTLQPHQHNAVVKLFLHKNNKHIFLTEYILDLSKYGKEKPIIEVLGTVKNHTLKVLITTEKETVHIDTVKIPLPCRGIYNRILLFSAIGIIFAALLFSGYRYMYSPKNKREKTAHERTGSSAVSSPIVPPSKKHFSSIQEKASFLSRKRVIYFYPDSIRLKKGEEKKITEIIKFLKKHPDYTITVSGYCALFGTQKGRIELSKKRAVKIAALLKKAGFHSGRSLKIEWFGAEDPLTTDPAQTDKNRRVEIYITSD